MAKGLTVSEMASLGGHARARKLTKEQRSESARKAVEARWRRRKEKIEDSLAKTRKAGAELRESVKELAKLNKRNSKKAQARWAKEKKEEQ